MDQRHHPARRAARRDIEQHRGPIVGDEDPVGLTLGKECGDPPTRLGAIEIERLYPHALVAIGQAARAGLDRDALRRQRCRAEPIGKNAAPTRHTRHRMAIEPALLPAWPSKRRLALLLPP